MWHACRSKMSITYTWHRTVNPEHLQMLRIDREGIIDDVIMHGTWRHWCNKKCAKKTLLELYHLIWLVYFPFFFSDFFTQLHKLGSLRRSFLHFHFISVVHIWYISYIINTHFFHGNIWTHNWPAPNVSGFIAQLAEHRTGNREVTGSNPVEVLNFFFQASLRNYINCLHCDDHFFMFIPIYCCLF